jgi:hypothetical protein
MELAKTFADSWLRSCPILHKVVVQTITNPLACCSFVNCVDVERTTNQQNRCNNKNKSLPIMKKASRELPFHSYT